MCANRYPTREKGQNDMKDIQTQREDMLDDKSELLPLIKTCYYQFIAN